jgi:poly(ADP-ribose) glycohydrolase
MTTNDWKSNEKNLTKFDIVHDSEGIEGSKGTLQADFANQYIGGGVLGRGCVQEEIRFVISPECLVSLLFCERMTDNEAILIRGTTRYTSYSGYGFGFKCEGVFQDDTSIDDEGFRDNYLVALDAIPFGFGVKMSRDDQYEEENILREINKVLA